MKRLPGLRAAAALLVVGLALAACGRNAALGPAVPGAVRLRLALPAGVTLEPARLESLFASIWVGDTRLAGPAAAAPGADGRFQLVLPAPAGGDRRVAVALLTDPAPSDPEGSYRGIRYLGLSEPFALAAGGTAAVTVTFQPFVTTILEAAPKVGRDVAIRFRSVPLGARYHLQVLRTDQLLRTSIARDTTVTDTAFVWDIAQSVTRVASYRLVARAEASYASGAWSPGVSVPAPVEPDLAGVVLSRGVPQADVLVQLLSCPGDIDTGRETFTNAAGRYVFLGVPRGAYRLRVFRGGCAELFDPPRGSECFTLAGFPLTRPELELTCTSAAQWVLCTLTWNDRPRDLDLHLYTPRIPDTGGAAYEVYYGATGATAEAPYAQLDADDTSGFGPENISIYRNFPGDYILAVHNFCCGDTLSRSGARVRIVAPGGQARTLTIAAPVEDTREWWIVARISGTNAAVTVIDTLSDRPPVVGLSLKGPGTPQMKERG